MSTHNSTSRPATLWVAVGLLVVLAVLTAIGGYLFNLSGADDVGEYVEGGVFVTLAVLYLAAAVRLPSGSVAWRTVAISAAAVHGVFNVVVKVGIEGETVSLMFVALTGAVVALLLAPPSRRFFDAAAAPRSQADRRVAGQV